jgi:hypothetical protein
VTRTILTELASCGGYGEERNADHADQNDLVYVAMAVTRLPQEGRVQHGGAGIEDVMHDDGPEYASPCCKVG